MEPQENIDKAATITTTNDDKIESDFPKIIREKRTRKISRRPSEEIEEGEYR